MGCGFRTSTVAPALSQVTQLPETDRSQTADPAAPGRFSMLLDIPNPFLDPKIVSELENGAIHDFKILIIDPDTDRVYGGLTRFLENRSDGTSSKSDAAPEYRDLQNTVGTYPG